MKKFLYMAVAAIAALSSCSSDDIVTNENGNGNNNANAPVFTATIEGEGATRTQLATGSEAGKKKVEWLNTDQVFIAAANGTTAALMGTYTVTPKSDATTATLNPVEPLTYFKSEVTPNEYVAIYPASISALKSQTAEGIGENDPDVLYDWYSRSIILPQTQKYNGTDISQIAPMAAFSSNTELQFQNLTALLAITVKAEDFSSVSSITVSTNEEAGFALAGDFTIDINKGVLSVAVSGWGTKYNSVTLNCQNEGANTAIDGSKTFYISIPANTYEYLQIEVTDGTNTKTMKTKAASISVERNKIYEIAFADNQTPAATGTALAYIAGIPAEVTWVQLWKNGPKWAAFNVGADSSHPYGNYYNWGAITPQTAENYIEYNSGQDDIQGNSDYDAATAIWGSNWQMPTADDFRNLISTDYTDGGVWKTAAETGYGIDGLLVTGKGAYAEYSVFFPAAGSYFEGTIYEPSYNTSGLYWSSTPDPKDEETAYAFISNDGDWKEVEIMGKNAGGYSVRAILK